MAVTVVGSVAFDAVETPFGRRERILGGAATHFSGQSQYLRPAIVRRMREGRPPAFPPKARDAQLLGGTIFALVEEHYGPTAAVELVSLAACHSRDYAST